MSHSISNGFLGCDLRRCNFDAVFDSLDGDGSGGTGKCSSWWADCELECEMTFRWWKCPWDVGSDDDRCNRFGDWGCAAVAAGATADVLWGVGGLTGCSGVGLVVLRRPEDKCCGLDISRRCCCRMWWRLVRSNGPSTSIGFGSLGRRSRIRFFFRLQPDWL